MQENVYPVVKGFIVFIVMTVIILMTMRMIFNQLDFNPFSFLGRFSYRLNKLTDRLVYPVASLMAKMNVETTFAPLIVIFIFFLMGYFSLQLFSDIFITMDGVFIGYKDRSITKIVGFLFYGFLGIYTLFIIIRIILSWVTSFKNPVTKFFVKLTDPVLEPFRRIIPPIGMLDISPIIVLLILNILQVAVGGVLLH